MFVYNISNGVGIRCVKLDHFRNFRGSEVTGNSPMPYAEKAQPMFTLLSLSLEKRRDLNE